MQEAFPADRKEQLVGCGMLQKLKAMRGSPLWVQFALTGATLMAAHFLQIPLETKVPGEPFLLFFMIVIAATLAFGEGAGLFGVGLSAFLATLFFEPLGSVALQHAGDLIKVEAYAFLAGACVVGLARLGRASIAAHEAVEILERAERNKSMLLHELTHRVANNFAAVAALINRKSSTVGDAKAKSVLEEAVGQVAVMARVHSRLHTGSDGIVLDSEDFLLELCKDLGLSMGRGRALSVECVAVNRPLAVAHAIALGLVVNELVTNAIKHAFPGERRGRIRVSLEEGEGQLCLCVEDDGAGYRGRPHGKGLGLDLVRALSDQLGGHMEVNVSDGGCTFRVIFPYVYQLSPFASRAPAELLH
jgi:two-component system, sensor histidine kinase PdtaS